MLWRDKCQSSQQSKSMLHLLISVAEISESMLAEFSLNALIPVEVASRNLSWKLDGKVKVEGNHI